MKLLLIRHAIAMEREAYQVASKGQDDALRPLTAEGEKKMRKVARGLTDQVRSLDLLISSPLVRAKQTAAIVADAFGDIDVTQVRELEPTRAPAEFLKWLKAQSHVKFRKSNRASRKPELLIACVGHEPHLSRLMQFLLTGQDISDEEQAAFVELRKGGAALLEFADDLAAGAARLEWLLKPSQLKL